VTRLRTEWTFPATIGTLPVVGEFMMADNATIPTHLDTPEISTYMSSNVVDDLHAPDPSGPVAVDERDVMQSRRPWSSRQPCGSPAGAGDTAGVASVGARFDARTSWARSARNT
jgi:hypothetical protein